MLRLCTGGDARERENSFHPLALAAGDVGFEIVADQQAILRPHTQLVTEIVEENRLRLAAEKGRDIGGISQKRTEGSTAEFDAARRGINPIGAHADQISAA